MKGEGRGTKADTSLFPVSADHMRGSSKLKLSSIEAHGHTGSPPLLGHPWQKQHMEVHMAISKHVGTPPSRRGTDGNWLVGTLMVCANILWLSQLNAKELS